MKLRTATMIACALGVAAWLVVVAATFMSQSDPATRGLDQASAVFVTALFLLTSVPAAVLLSLRRAPITALVLGLAFPALLATAFVMAVIVFA